ncbi:MAG: hypothetical protein BMS9Abin33_0775 [Gammaproteobacteria bacterium]|nr:MAG: hypothetical protein BMS9Abin33_0775 [Gammaproteobacteria bacterium]
MMYNLRPLLCKGVTHSTLEHQSSSEIYRIFRGLAGCSQFLCYKIRIDENFAVTRLSDLLEDVVDVPFNSLKNILNIPEFTLPGAC